MMQWAGVLAICVVVAGCAAGPNRMGADDDAMAGDKAARAETPDADAARANGLIDARADGTGAADGAMATTPADDEAAALAGSGNGASGAWDVGGAPVRMHAPRDRNGFVPGKLVSNAAAAAEAAARRGKQTLVADPFFAGEFIVGGASAEASGSAPGGVRAGNAEGVSYIYWDDFENGVVANAPNKPLSRLSFEGGDWHIRCGAPDRKAASDGCRMGITYMDTGLKQRLTAIVVHVSRSDDVTVCVGDGGRAASATLKVDNGPRFDARASACFSSADSADILKALTLGKVFVFSRTDPSRQARTGWLSPYGLEQAMALMAWMGGRVGKGG